MLPKFGYCDNLNLWTSKLTQVVSAMQKNAEIPNDAAGQRSFTDMVSITWFRLMVKSGIVTYPIQYLSYNL